MFNLGRGGSSDADHSTSGVGVGLSYKVAVPFELVYGEDDQAHQSDGHQHDDCRTTVMVSVDATLTDVH